MRRVKILTLIAVVAVISIIASGCKSVNTNDGAKALCMSRMKVPFAPVMEHKDKKSEWRSLGPCAVRYFLLGPKRVC